MCIVIDTNTLSHVFNKNDERHSEFKPVLDWIMEGQGKVVYGGTKYLAEIGKKLLPLLVQLKAANKAVRVDDKPIDKKADKLAEMIQHADFDDQHIVALLMTSGCKLVCSLDARAYPYFQHSSFFTGKKKLKIYSGAKNSGLLCSHNIAKLCMPCERLNRKQKVALGFESE